MAKSTAEAVVTDSGYDRIPFLITFAEAAGFKDTYAGEMGRVVLKAHHLRPRARASDTVVIFMHPIGGGEYLPLPIALARAGVHVIYCNSRYVGVDYALIMEKVALDLGACVRHAREKLGYRRVVLAGWSGGGSLSAFYQAQAERPSVRCTPAGDPPDLTAANLMPADGLMLLAAHVSRARTLTEWLDASIIDENRPEHRDPELDLYSPENPNQPPYTQQFLARYRLAQEARNRRITAWVREKLTSLRDAGRVNEEYGFVVHGTMADPRWIDPSVDPNDRRPGWCFLGDPRIVNNGPVGLARFCTLRSWLSQWSLDESNADGVKSLATVSVPVLVVGNTADDACTPSHTHRLFDAVVHDRRRMEEIPGANHYYFGQPQLANSAAQVVGTWLLEQGLWDPD
jgi:dienelactone hydrolase/diadenosine tetraphosphatase ApaH/serine/threonine PP2A family protein phosphatase